MWFFRFQRACIKYNFLYELNNYNNEFKLILRPSCNLDNITKLENYKCYRKLFKEAINIMKQYRKV